MKKPGVIIILLAAMPVISKAQEKKTNTGPDKDMKNSESARSYPLIPISQLDQRRIYNWGNGQKATAMGRQAGDAKAKYVKLMGDSAVVVYDWRDKIRSAKKDESAKN